MLSIACHDVPRQFGMPSGCGFCAKDRARRLRLDCDKKSLFFGQVLRKCRFNRSGDSKEEPIRQSQFR